MRVSLRFNVLLFIFLGGIPFSSLAQVSDTTLRYILHAGDKIVIHYELTPEFDQPATIQPDNYIPVNLCGEVKVGGLTLAQAVDALRACAATRLVNPRVQVSLSDFQTPYYVVAGEVNEPKRYEMRETITALQALMIAGGPKVTARRSQVILLLGAASGHPQIRLIDIKSLQKRIPDNPVLSSGDIVYVPFSKIHSMQQIANLLSPFSYSAWSINGVAP